MTDLEKAKELEKNDGFIKYNNYHVIEAERGVKVVMEADLTKEALNPYGFAHGGLIFGLGDTAMGILSKSTDKNAVTLSSTINYLRPTVGTKVKAVAEIVKDGKKTCYLKCNFYDDKERLTAIMDANYYYIEEE